MKGLPNWTCHNEMRGSNYLQASWLLVFASYGSLELNRSHVDRAEYGIIRLGIGIGQREVLVACG
jgi:hypothetical protein